MGTNIGSMANRSIDFFDDQFRRQSFPAPGGTVKAFSTVIARKPRS